MNSALSALWAWQNCPRVHQSTAWPCIPDEVWINELWTSNSGIAPSSPPQIINLVKFTADKNAGKINIGHGTHLSLNIVTRTRTSSSSSEEISKASNYAMCGRAQRTRQSAKQHLLPDKSNLWQAVSARSTPVSHILCTLIYAISSQK